jgi:hypothetical protein
VRAQAQAPPARAEPPDHAAVAAASLTEDAVKAQLLEARHHLPRRHVAGREAHRLGDRDAHGGGGLHDHHLAGLLVLCRAMKRAEATARGWVRPGMGASRLQGRANPRAASAAATGADRAGALPPPWLTDFV